MLKCSLTQKREQTLKTKKNRIFLQKVKDYLKQIRAVIKQNRLKHYRLILKKRFILS